MKIDNPSGDADCHNPAYSVQFIPRRVEDLKHGYPREAFERVRKVSEINETFYQAFVSPWVQMVATPWTAEVGKWLHPMRTSCFLLSEVFNPWMRRIRLAVGAVAKNRRPLASDHPLLAQERRMDDEIAEILECMRTSRDAVYETIFSALYQGLSADLANSPMRSRSGLRAK